MLCSMCLNIMLYLSVSAEVMCKTLANELQLVWFLHLLVLYLVITVQNKEIPVI